MTTHCHGTSLLSALTYQLQCVSAHRLSGEERKQVDVATEYDAAVVATLDGSLARLGLKTINLYYIHYPLQGARWASDERAVVASISHCRGIISRPFHAPSCASRRPKRA
jgi:hypothetical protein